MLKGANLKGGGDAPAPPIDQPPLVLNNEYIIWIYIKMSFISVIQTEFSALLLQCHVIFQKSV